MSKKKQNVQSEEDKRNFFKSKYLLRAIQGDWWITGNHVIIDDHYFEYRKRNWHLISVDSLQFHWQYVESIIVDKHIFGATLKVTAGKEYYYIKGLSKKTADAIKKLALNYISINTQRGTTEALAGAIAQAVKGNGGNNTPSPADELMKFKKLHDAGAISDEEFEKAKKKILS